MPAIDNLFGNGAIHISDRNKKIPVATLCGQALDKESIRFFENVENFDQATCKVCRRSFFDEDWTSGNSSTGSTEQIQESTQETDQPKEPVKGEVIRTTLFGGLKAPINKHTQENNNGD